MPELSPVTQHWLNVVLIWVGFGTLAGLVARVVLPLKEPQGPFATLTLGVAGSAVGLGVLTWLQGGQTLNPVSPLGFLAAVGGAAGLLLVFTVGRLVVHRTPPADAETDAIGEEELE